MLATHRDSQSRTRWLSAWVATPSKPSWARRHTSISPHSSRVARPATSRTAATTRTCCGRQFTNKLCLECHGPEAEPKKLESEHLVTIFDGKVKLPENYFAKVPVLPLKYGIGHPTDRHPVSDTLDPKNPGKVVTRYELSELPPATFFGKRGFAGKGSGEWHGFLQDLPLQRAESECGFKWSEVTMLKDQSNSVCGSRPHQGEIGRVGEFVFPPIWAALAALARVGYCLGAIRLRAEEIEKGRRRSQSRGKASCLRY